MPKISADTVESISDVEQVIVQFIQDVRKSTGVDGGKGDHLQYRLFKSLQDHLNLDRDGRVSFKVYVINFRRKSVVGMFDGKNYEEIAKSLGIPVDTVKNDIRWYYEHHHKKK